MSYRRVCSLKALVFRMKIPEAEVRKALPKLGFRTIVLNKLDGKGPIEWVISDSGPAPQGTRSR